MHKVLYIITLFLFVTTICSAQQDTLFKPKYSDKILYEIQTNSGLKYKGYIVEEKSYGIILKNPKTGISTYFYNSEIYSVKPFVSKQSHKADMALFDENSHTDSYMISTSSFLFEQGKITSTYHWGFIDNITFPVNENWAITANTIFIYPYSLGLKCAYKVSENSYIGGSLFGMFNLGSKTPSENFIGYCSKVNYTQGTSNNNFTVAGGVLGLNANLFTLKSQAPFLNLYFGNFSFCSRFSKLFAFVGEAWYFPQAESGFAGIGLKLVNNQYNCWTFGCYGILNNLSTGLKVDVKAIPIPYIGYSQSF